MIEVVKAKKYYNRHKRNQVTAIDNTTLSFGDSGLVAILGNSGCGKTTLLNMIGGLDKPDSGKIFVNGKKMNGMFSGHTDNIRNKNIGYIFQNYHLVDDMTVFDNVALPLKMLGVRDKNKIKENVYYALEMVGLYRYRNRPATALSGGERQRVGIARAIVKNPGIIIADEPTGNLDSGNSIEIMNIIKAISKEKLVILVTHERTLAQFYADRIIEIVDGKVVSDADNEHDDSLDYRIDNKLYLKDFEKQENLAADGVNLSFYSDGSANLDVKLVLRNGNIYIECGGLKTEVVDQDSSIELVDDHYHALSKEEAEKNKFDYSRLETGKKKLRYHSIYNIFTLFSNGVKKILNYPVLKKILLLGFVASAMFIMYSVSNVIGVNTIKDSQFVRVDKSYLMIKNSSNTLDLYNEAESLEGVKYIIPGESIMNFTFDYSNYYYQTNGAQDQINGSISAVSNLEKDKLIAGRVPENNNEIVLDKLLFTSIFEYGQGTMIGLSAPEAYIGKECQLGYDTGVYYTVVGICDTEMPVIYAMDDELFNMVMKSSLQDGKIYVSGDENNNADIKAIENAKGEIKIKSGRMPENDYEVIVPYDFVYTNWIGQQLNQKVNGQKLKIVGFYTSSESREQDFFTNFNTFRNLYIVSTSNITICPSDKEAVLAYFRGQGMGDGTEDLPEEGIGNVDISTKPGDTPEESIKPEGNRQNIVDTYEDAKRSYMNEVKESIKLSTIIAGIVLGVSLVEIFLMLRSSFLSRVKEVGTLRAIGLKKSDVYKMFFGEILVITTLTAPIGFVIMGYVLKTLTSVSYFCSQYVFDARVVLISAAIIYGFNILIGLLPVFFTLGKTPAKILARTDVD